ncbi:MAG: hypothetical protein AAFW73_01160 [Bacteroidota bacterium]
MKKILYLSLVAVSLSLTSCINVIEELFLNKDGSGKYHITIDMSSIMADGGMRSMMQQFGGDELNNPDNPFASEEPIEVDSVMYMKDAPDSLRQAFGNDDLLKRIKIHQIMSESKEVMTTQFILDFKEIAEVDEFLQKLDKLQTDDNPFGGGGGGLLPSSNGQNALFQLAKRSLTRNAVAGGDAMDAIGDQEKGMMRMMLADATYKVVYHLPGKVKKTTMEGALVDGKTVTLEFPAVDAMEGKAKMDGNIKFKNR